MNFFKRAIKNVTRKLPKSILLILTFFLIGNLVIVGLGVSNAASKAKTLTRQKMRAVVTVSVDYDEVWQYADTIEDEDELNDFYENYPSVKLQDVRTLLSDERVKTANATEFFQLYNNADKSISYCKLNNEAEKQMDEVYEDGDIDLYSSYYYENPIIGMKSNYFPSMIEIQEDKYSIIDGRFYNEEEIANKAKVCVITQEFAQLNDLKVGDTLSLAIYQIDGYITEYGIDAEDLKLDMEVVGIYAHTNHITPDSENYDYTYPYENPDNLILCPGGMYELATLTIQQKEFDYYKSQWPDDEYYNDPANYPSIEKINDSGISDTTLLLNDPLDVDDFIADYEDQMPQFIKIDADNEEFERLSKPLDTLSLYADFIVYLVVINAIVIITLVTALTLKTREYEIGVLLSIGASKLKVIAQFFVELALVAVVGFTLAIGSGSLIAGRVGETVLEYQIQESDLDEGDDYYYYYNDYESPWDNDYTTDITLDDLISEYSVSVSPLIIAEIYVVGLGIVLISVIIPSIMIMRFNPKKILMNQN